MSATKEARIDQLIAAYLDRVSDPSAAAAAVPAAVPAVPAAVPAVPATTAAASSSSSSSRQSHALVDLASLGKNRSKLTSRSVDCTLALFAALDTANTQMLHEILRNDALDVSRPNTNCEHSSPLPSHAALLELSTPR
jgi:hypothetical protein